MSVSWRRSEGYLASAVRFSSVPAAYVAFGDGYLYLCVCPPDAHFGRPRLHYAKPKGETVSEERVSLSVSVAPRWRSLNVARAGAGGGADAARGREQGGLLRRVQQARPAQALPGAVAPPWQESEPGQFRDRRGSGAVRRAVAGGAGGGAKGCSSAVTADGRGGAAAGAGGGLLRREPRQSRPAQALLGAREARWQAGEPGQLRHCRRGGAVCRAVAGGASGGGGAGCSGAAADERGGAAAGAGGGADAARGRPQDGLLRRAAQQPRQAQALCGAVEARWQERAPGHVRHRRGGGAVRRAVAAVRRAVAGGAGGGEETCSGGAADERGGAAAGAGGGADAARGREQGGLLVREPQSVQQDQALRGAGEARGQESVPGLLRNRRGGGAVRCAVAGGAGGGGKGGVGGQSGLAPSGAVRRNPQGEGHDLGHGSRRRT
eukprot:scaffold7007_cov66-Phaeocystis_antarctica.AAC.2